MVLIFLKTNHCVIIALEMWRLYWKWGDCVEIWLKYIYTIHVCSSEHPLTEHVDRDNSNFSFWSPLIKQPFVLYFSLRESSISSIRRLFCLQFIFDYIHILLPAGPALPLKDLCFSQFPECTKNLNSNVAESICASEKLL